MKKKEVINLLISDFEQIVPNDFHSVETKISKTEKYIEFKLQNEGKNCVADKPLNFKPERKPKKIFTWKMAVPLGIGLATCVALPIIITSNTQPVSYCDASVKTTFDNNENELMFRSNIKDSVVDITNIKPLNTRARIALSGIVKKHIYQENNTNFADFFATMQEFLLKNKFIDDKNDFKIDVIGSEEKSKQIFEGFEHTFTNIGSGSDLIYAESCITILDASNRLFNDNKPFDSPFTYNQILDSLKGHEHFDELAKSYEHLNEIIPFDEDINGFRKDFGPMNGPIPPDFNKMGDYVKGIEPGKGNPTPGYVKNENEYDDDYWYNQWSYWED